jgi:hypothetical protein
MPNEKFFSYMMTRMSYIQYMMTRMSYIQWDDDIRYVLDQHAWMDFYSNSSLKQQSAGRNVASLGHIILIPIQPVLLLLLNATCLVE